MVAASSLRRFGSVAPGGTGISISAVHPAYRSGRSIFQSRIFDPDEVQRVFKTGHQSRKIGKFVIKGPRRGWPIFTLTLEERATCPRSCRAWAECYGNNMQAAERLSAGPPLERQIWEELAELQRRHSGGFMIRLHVLGDFYSLGYVDLWRRALVEFPALHVFGFTARLPDTPMGAELYAMATADWARFAIRFSGLPDREMASILAGDEGSDVAIACPAQTGAADCCATCALCWHSTRSIRFARH